MVGHRDVHCTQRPELLALTPVTISPPNQRTIMTSHKIEFLDYGYCTICTSTVQYVIRMGKNGGSNHPFPAKGV